MQKKIGKHSMDYREIGSVSNETICSTFENFWQKIMNFFLKKAKLLMISNPNKHLFNKLQLNQKL